MIDQIRLRPFDIADQRKAIEAGFTDKFSKRNRRDGYVGAELAIDLATDEGRSDGERDRARAVRQRRVEFSLASRYVQSCTTRSVQPQ